MRVAGRVSPRRARYFSLLRQRKVPKRKATLQSATPSRCEGANLRRGVCGVRRGTHCAAAQLRSDNPGESVDEACALRRACPPRKRPAAGAARRGLKAAIHTGHRCARPGLRGAQRLRPWGPSAAMARNLPSPSARAEKRRARGGRVPKDTRLRGLTCCGCPNGAPQARSEFRSMPRERASQVAPARSVGVTGGRVALSLLTFFRRSERK